MPIDQSKLVLDIITAHHFHVEPVKLNPKLGEGFLDRVSMIGGRPLDHGNNRDFAIALSRAISAADRTWSRAAVTGETAIGAFDIVLRPRTEKPTELRLHVEDASILAYEPFDYLDANSDRFVNERLVVTYSRIKVEPVLLDEEDDDGDS